MIDIVHCAEAVANVDQRRQNIKDIFLVEYAFAFRIVATNPTVELHASNARQVIAIRIKEQVLEQVLSSFLGRRLARTHHAVDFNQCFETCC